MGIRQSPVRWYLHTFRVLIAFLVMLTVCSSKIYLHPASHNFQIEMRELFESPGGKCASLPLSGNWVNASVHSVFYGIMFPPAGEIKTFTLCVFIFMGIVWPDVCSIFSYIRGSIFFCTIYCVGVSGIVDILEHLYNIIIIGFL